MLISSSHISVKTSGISCNRGQALASDFLTKNTLCSTSISRILNLNCTNDLPKIYDFTSVYVLLRSLFEGYINMYYVLIDPKTDSEKEFKLDLCDRNALYERQKMGEFIGFKHLRLLEEKESIEKYTESIKKSNYFKSLKDNEKQSYIETEKWTKSKWKERADKSNIHESHFEFFYKLLSNYAHSEPFALMQIHDVKSPKITKELTYLQMELTEMYLSLTLKLFSKLLPEAKVIIERDGVLLKIINFWEDFKKKDLKNLMNETHID